MPSNFDLLESAMMDVVTNQFGYPATWTPSAGGDQQSGMVLFNDPTKKGQVQAINFDGDTYPWIEFKKGTFDGLRESVKNTRNKEIVNVDGVDYYCRFNKNKYDGDTIQITLELKQ